MFSPVQATALLASLSTLVAAKPVIRGNVIDVVVGGPGGVLKYQPESVTANPGDVIRFTFQQKNHTVTQSTLATPCSPMANGFNSGFIPVADTQTGNFPIAELSVDDTNPIWVYCQQGNHCQQGMVFAVNPGDKMDQFKAAATGNSTAAPSASAAPPAASSAAAPAPSAGTDHRIIVGGPGKLLFDPSNITAAAGDTVTFEFRQKSHSVTQSSFASPCTAAGFDSGLMPVPDDQQGNFPTYQLKVNDTNPVWAYCKQATHCQQGMVFSINANESSDKSFGAFKQKAMSTSTNPSAPSAAAGAASTNQPNGAVRLSGRRDAGIALSLFGVLLGSLVL